MPKAKPRPEPTLMTLPDVAAVCSLSTETIRDWVAKGLWPEPHAAISRVWLYRRSVIEHWLARGEWPKEARFKAGQGRGRVASAAVADAEVL